MAGHRMSQDIRPFKDVRAGMVRWSSAMEQRVLTNVMHFPSFRSPSSYPHRHLFPFTFFLALQYQTLIARPKTSSIGSFSGSGMALAKALIWLSHIRYGSRLAKFGDRLELSFRTHASRLYPAWLDELLLTVVSTLQKLRKMSR